MIKWEKDRTQPDLSYIQKEALKRAQLTNITLKITFCPACDTPNAEGFTRCQVCDAPLAVSSIFRNREQPELSGKEAQHFERDNQAGAKSRSFQ